MSNSFFPTISSGTNYWFIRTDGGRLYNAFFRDGAIGLGYPEITIEDMRMLETKDTHGVLLNKIKKYNPNHKRPGLIESQLNKFKNEIKAGDFIIIPNSGTREIAIGRVSNSKLFKGKPFTVSRLGKDTEERDFFKQKAVVWLKKIKKKKIHPKLIQMFNSHQTINSANDYAQFIDLSVYDAYEKEGNFNVILNVESEDKIKARDLYDTMVMLMDVAENIAEIYIGKDAGTGDIDSQVNLNSPGQVLLSARQRFALFAISIVIYGCTGGQLKGKAFGGEIEVGIEKGLIAHVRDYLNDEANRELKAELTEKLKKIKVATPKEFKALLDSLTKLEYIKK